MSQKRILLVGKLQTRGDGFKGRQMRVLIEHVDFGKGSPYVLYDWTERRPGHGDGKHRGPASMLQAAGVYLRMAESRLSSWIRPGRVL